MDLVGFLRVVGFLGGGSGFFVCSFMELTWKFSGNYFLTSGFFTHPAFYNLLHDLCYKCQVICITSTIL